MKNTLKAFFSFFLFLFMKSILVYILKIDESLLLTIDRLYLMYFSDAFTLIIVIFLFKDAVIKELSDQAFEINKAIKYFINFLGLKVIISLVIVIVSVIFKLDYNMGANQEVIFTLANESKLIMFILTILIAPVLEELVFRLAFLKAIKNKIVFVLTSGLIFGLLHVFPYKFDILLIMQSLTYIILGMYLAYIYAKEENLKYPIIVHLLNNLLGFIALYSVI